MLGTATTTASTSFMASSSLTDAQARAVLCFLLNAAPLAGLTSQTPAMGIPARVAVSACTLPIAPAPMIPRFIPIVTER